MFSFLPGLGSAATARRLHMLASYWGLVLMGLHLGLHWGVMAALYALDHFCMMALSALLAHAAVSLARKRQKGAAKP